MEYPQLAFIDLKRQYERIKGDLSPRLEKVLSSAAFIQGPDVRELEEELAAYVKVRHAVTCANGTDALTLPLLAWDLRPGDAVFCPTFTFIATSEVVSLRGATPVFVDVDPVTFNMDPKDLENKIRLLRSAGEYVPRAVITVDLFGLPADYDAIRKVAEAHDLLILEDAAQGFGGRIGEREAGSFGNAGATSFFPAKPLGCYGDGGAVFTDDPALAEALRSLRAHGQGSDKYEHVRIGQNSRLDTLQAAVLLSKLKAFPEELELRQRAAKGYEERLSGIVTTPKVPKGFLSSWAQYTVRVPSGQRGRIAASMKARGVPTMVYYPRPVHLQPAYRPFGGRKGDCPVAEALSSEVLSLPMHPYLTEADQDQVAGALKAALSEGR
ncbi:MAG: DegT/DnrJ/EryC1/StrS family aminotransferase [Deltaproteobacteria bacterium]|jgi:dTDP-4-amino-4,6-dideoxygalactose transaminase|nr:DegT/DnrJ/EryC1/StrS family aminotransferase [Deltaproteobacteria bacterium]